jgi:hypothetical protein
MGGMGGNNSFSSSFTLRKHEPLHRSCVSRGEAGKGEEYAAGKRWRRAFGAISRLIFRPLIESPDPAVPGVIPFPVHPFHRRLRLAVLLVLSAARHQSMNELEKE